MGFPRRENSLRATRDVLPGLTAAAQSAAGHGGPPLFVLLCVLCGGKIPHKGHKESTRTQAKTSKAPTQRPLLDRRQTDQRAIRLRDGQQGGLAIAPHAIKRVVELPLSALAVQNHLFPPAPKEDRALLRKIVDHGLHKRIMQPSAVIGSELGHDPAGSLLPTGDQTPCGRREKYETQQIPLLAAIEPADEQAGRRAIPGPGGPSSVEEIGRNGNDGREVEKVRRNVAFIVEGSGRVTLARQIEKISPFGRGQMQRLREASQSRGGSRNVPTLLQPSNPGGADAANIRQLLPAQSGSSAARGGAGRRRHPFTMGAQECAEDAARVRLIHGGLYTRILCRLVPV